MILFEVIDHQLGIMSPCSMPPPPSAASNNIILRGGVGGPPRAMALRRKNSELVYNDNFDSCSEDDEDES
jgi:hypothetical protein